jgi:hypothetical protein
MDDRRWTTPFDALRWFDKLTTGCSGQVEDRGRKTEDGRRTMDDGGQKTEDGRRKTDEG